MARMVWRRAALSAFGRDDSRIGWVKVGPPRSRGTDTAKRVVDVSVGGGALVCAAPVIAVAAVAVRAVLGRPILFRQARTGAGGRPFELLKLRTMRAPMAGEQDPSFDGLRLTGLGRLLRATSIDELPSLWNVLRGELSLVGPRPLPVRYVDRYSATEARRLEVKPGLTGLAQVSGRNSLSWAQKFELDVWYVDHRSLALDMRILVRTLFQVLGGRGISQADHATMPEFTGSPGVVSPPNEGNRRGPSDASAEPSGPL